MSSTATPKKPTVASLAREVRRIREQMQDLQDLLELRGAIHRNGKRPGSAWNKIKDSILRNGK
ncbi:hypothetical protein EBZ02_08970 [bacterium]|nr:hypothetical protein [bacterium]NDA10748.1 hypothetical protein [Verrucomicrobiota bacterium]NDA26798.1 hypothetical protein [Verrucomicrobiota bacterium]NDD82476.1 hypothetical protein [Verrucomicrobiota bacterium]